MKKSIIVLLFLPLLYLHFPKNLSNIIRYSENTDNTEESTENPDGRGSGRRLFVIEEKNI